MSAPQLQTDIIVAYILLTSLNIGGSLTTAEKSFFFPVKVDKFCLLPYADHHDIAARFLQMFE